MIIQRPIRDGGIAGFLAGFLGLIAYYIGLVVWAAVTMGDWVAALLSAVTVIPLMLLLVVAVPHAVLSVLLGIVVAYSAKLGGKVVGFFFALIAGVGGSFLLFTGLIPMISRPKPGEHDFTSVIANPYAAGAYGIFLGFLTWRFLQRTAR